MLVKIGEKCFEQLNVWSYCSNERRPRYVCTCQDEETKRTIAKINHEK